MTLDSCAKNKQLEQRIELKLNREPKKAELLASVQTAIELNLVNMNELQNFILKTDIMDSGDDELDQIRKSLEQKLDYQTDKMVKGIMDMVDVQTTDVLNSILASLGDDWRLDLSYVISFQAGDTPYAIRIGIANKIHQHLKVKIIVNPDIIDNKLVISFRDDFGFFSQSETFDTHIQDLQSGINWETFRNILRGHYKGRLKNLTTQP